MNEAAIEIDLFVNVLFSSARNFREMLRKQQHPSMS